MADALLTQRVLRFPDKIYEVAAAISELKRSISGL